VQLRRFSRSAIRGRARKGTSQQGGGPKISFFIACVSLFLCALRFLPQAGGLYGTYLLASADNKAFLRPDNSLDFRFATAKNLRYKIVSSVKSASSNNLIQADIFAD